MQIFVNPQTRKFKIGQSLVLSTSGFKQWKSKKTHTPPTLNTHLAGGDGGIASWPLQFEKDKDFWKFENYSSVLQTSKQ